MKSLLVPGLILSLFSSCSNRVEANSSHHDSLPIDSIEDTPITETASSGKPAVPTDSTGEGLTLAFTGDIMMGTTYPEGGNYLPAHDGANLFKEVKSILCSADIAAGNLEGTLLDGKGAVKKCSNPSLCYAFRMPQRYAKHLVDAGFDFMGIANNHINDFGSPGLTSTQKTLTQYGVAYAGLRNSCPTAILERNGKKIGFAAFGHNKGTLNIMNLEEVRNVVSGLRKSCDFVIVSFHGGGEGKNFQHVPHKMEICFGENRGDVEKFAHTAIDSGADVVFGHGPHVTRALELYKGHLIAYSLGNFCTPYRMGLAGVNGYCPVLTVELTPDGKFSSGKIHSFIQHTGTGPQPNPTNDVAKNMRRLSQSDFPKSGLIIADDGTLSSN